MTLANSMLFFDVSYGEYASATGTNLITSTAVFAYDNRSDGGNVEFNTTTGEFIYDFGASVSYNIDSLILTGHNFSNFSFAVALTSTGTWTTLTSYSNQTGTTNYYDIGTSTVVYDAKVNFTTVQTGTGYFGEFIVTKKKFQPTNNPSAYVPRMVPVITQNTMWNGKNVFSKRADSIFEADIGWDNLQGSADTMVNTDLQNVTELIRKNTTFLFWPNGYNTSTVANMYTWRQQDIFKCKIVDAASYEFISPAVDYIIKGTGYKIQEVM